MDVQGKMFLPCRTPQDPWWRAPSYLGVTFWVTHESWSTIVTTKLWFSGEGWPASVNLVISITSLIIKKQNKTKGNQYKQTVQKCWMLSKASIYFCDRYEPQKKSKNEERKEKKKRLAGKCWCTAAHVITHCWIPFSIHMPGTIDLRQGFFIATFGRSSQYPLFTIMLLRVCFHCKHLCLIVKSR